MTGLFSQNDSTVEAEWSRICYEEVINKIILYYSIEFSIISIFSIDLKGTDQIQPANFGG